MLPGQDPGLVGGARRIGHYHSEVRGEADHPDLIPHLLPDEVAVHAAALVCVVFAALAQLAADVVEDDGHRRHPRVRMLDARARLAVAPRDQDVTDGRVLLEVPEAVAVHPQDLLPLRLVHPGRSDIV